MSVGTFTYLDCQGCVSVPYVRDVRWDISQHNPVAAKMGFSPLRKGCPLGLIDVGKYSVNVFQSLT